MRTPIRLSVIAALALWAAPRAASAYPQWQFSSGAERCNQCHFAPAGGGLITGYGRDAAGEELSTWEGDGGFLHGAVDLPSWLALGGDLRGMVLSHDAGDPRGAKLRAFPMQADVHARVALGSSLSVAATAGYLGQVRDADELQHPNVYQPASGYRFISREHYVMWRPAALGPYVRAGRFFAPFGLRLAEHTVYTRRDVGLGMLQETYGVSGGVVRKGWELHLTGFAPDFLRDMGGNERGFAGMLEVRVGDASALGIQTRIGQQTDLTRFIGGAFAKTWIEPAKLMLMAEGDLIHNTFGGDVTARQQAVAYLGATLLPIKGIWVSAYGEFSQTSLNVKDTATTAGTLQLNWFPCPHFELVLLGRQQMTGQDAMRTAFFQVHYYL